MDGFSSQAPGINYHSNRLQRADGNAISESQSPAKRDLSPFIPWDLSPFTPAGPARATLPTTISAVFLPAVKGSGDAWR